MRTPEAQFGHKVVSYLGVYPQVSEDVAARLAFARNLALEKVRVTRKPEVRTSVLTLSPLLSVFKRLVLGALLVATVLVYFQPDQGTGLSLDQEMELQYHQTADQPFPGEY